MNREEVLRRLSHYKSMLYDNYELKYLDTGDETQRTLRDDSKIVMDEVIKLITQPQPTFKEVEEVYEMLIPYIDWNSSEFGNIVSETKPYVIQEILEQALNHNVSDEMDITKKDVVFDMLDSVYGVINGSRINKETKWYTYSWIEDIKKLLNEVTLQPNLDTLRSEIIDELQKTRTYETVVYRDCGDFALLNDKNKGHYELENIYCRISKTSLDFPFGTTLSIASKIIKYFELLEEGKEGE